MTDEVSEMVARVARAIFEDIRFASNIYIFYVGPNRTLSARTT